MSHASPADRTRAAKLRARLRRRFDIVTQTCAIGPLRLPFVRVADPDKVLDEIVEAEDRHEKLTGMRRDGNQLHLPYWAELWESAFGVGAWLTSAGAKRFSHFPPPDVLDLGCGMGLSGVVAAALGARVTLVDLEADALLFARLNTLAWRSKTQVRRVDWQVDQLRGKFDLILGADVLYDRGQWPSLEKFFRAHLKPGGSVVLGEPGRQTGDRFPGWIADQGWTLTPHSQPIAGRVQPIRLFEIRFKPVP